MYIITVILIYKMYLSCSGTSQVLPRSPCPTVFHYERTGGSSRANEMPFKGVITVATSTLPVSLKVKLQIPAALFKEYNGRLEVAERKLEPSEEINSGSFEKVRYNLYYPKNIPLPKIILIQLNNKVLCSTNPIRSPMKTLVVWEHSLKSGKTKDHKHGKKLDDPELRVERWPENGGKDMERPQPQETCGKPIRAVLLIVGGAEAKRGDWPWMVPIFRRTELGLRFICASTLISDQFVVTAAHCLEDHRYNLLDKNDVIAYPGKYDIKNWVEEGIQPREISEIHVHPDYDPLTVNSDLALLRLKKPLKISRFANPACIWDEEADLDLVVGKRGLISGWGTYGSGSRFRDKANLAIMPIASQEECLRSNPELLFYTSERTFCAGTRNDSGPCNGDSGTGLMLPRNDRNGINRWYLRGVLSLSLVAENHRPIGCNLGEYAVFTDIAKYKTWISDVMKNAAYVYQ